MGIQNSLMETVILKFSLAAGNSTMQGCVIQDRVEQTSLANLTFVPKYLLSLLDYFPFLRLSFLSGIWGTLSGCQWGQCPNSVLQISSPPSASKLVGELEPLPTFCLPDMFGIFGRGRLSQALNVWIASKNCFSLICKHALFKSSESIYYESVLRV